MSEIPSQPNPKICDSAKVSWRRLDRADKPAMLAIAERIWKGDDYLARVYDKWIREPRAAFVGLWLDERLAGCGRLSELSRSCGWLEALRIDPDLQRRGLGRLMSAHMIEAARQEGFEELLFSTYFDNYGSIAINEDFCFKRIATFTTLNLNVDALDSIPQIDADHPALEVQSGLPDLAEMIWNGWVFLPADTIDRPAYFPNAETVRASESTFLLAANNKAPERMNEICWLTHPEGEGSRLCLDYAIAACHRQGKKHLHLMLPESMPAGLFLENGFTVYEREKDVFLYRGRIENLRTD